VRDTGVQGSIAHYALIFSFMGVALFGLIYAWKKGLLSMGEEPKEQMMKEEESDYE